MVYMKSFDEKYPFVSCISIDGSQKLQQVELQLNKRWHKVLY